MFQKVVLASALVVSVAAQSGAYGQCGGIGWSGATTCISGWTCTYSNPYYSQCLPGGPTTSSTSMTTMPTTTTKSTTTTTNPTTSTKPTTTTPSTTMSSSSTGTAPGAGSTLTPPNLWIRAVEAPNFHHYLQPVTANSPSTAVFGDYTTAAQFQLVNGQVVQQLGGGKVQYLTVIPATSTTATYLGTKFTTAPNGYGTFSFSGDGLNWSSPNVTRSNTGAFLACGTQGGTGSMAPTVNINLGAYAYMTPAGCADETLNYYNGATAVN